MMTLRLDPKLEQKIDGAAKNLGITKSELVRKSVIEYLGKLDKATPWEAGRDLFGNYGSGRDDLSTDRKRIVKQKIRDKRH